MKNALYFLGAFLILQTVSCGPSSRLLNDNGLANNRPANAQFDIVGGELVVDQSFAKYVVGIYNRTKNYWCTGTLIGNDTLLAAAHCFMGRAGDHQVLFPHLHARPPQKSKIISYTPHPLYNPSSWTERHDLAVARFAAQAPPTSAAIQLPTAEDLARGATDFLALGFGTTTARRDLHPPERGGIFRYTSLVIMEGPLTTDQIQFTVDQTSGHGVCFGDSGGPALLDVGDHHTVIGVVSAVYSKIPGARDRPDFDVCRYNAIYIAVFPYLDWIKRNSAELSSR